MSDYTLAVDGSTYSGSVAVIRGREVIEERSLPESAFSARGERGEDFMPMVVECLAAASTKPRDLARVVCGAGPGSFTSLRIAASIAKGIAVGAGCPLFAVSSLLLIPAAAQLPDGRYLSVLSAMRGESYALDVVVGDGALESSGSARLLPASLLANEADSNGLTVIGPDVGDGLRPHARGVARLLDQILAGGPCDVRSWEPDYGRLAEAQVKWEAAHGRPLVVDA
jgi:tRNA threonylcarbamoyladenosine biosynthesis protein TsaB